MVEVGGFEPPSDTHSLHLLVATWHSLSGGSPVGGPFGQRLTTIYLTAARRTEHSLEFTKGVSYVLRDTTVFKTFRLQLMLRLTRHRALKLITFQFIEFR